MSAQAAGLPRASWAWLLALPLAASLALFGGAWLGRWLIGNPVFGAMLGGGNLIAAMVARARDRPGLVERYYAALDRESPHLQLLPLLAWAFVAELVAGGLGAFAGGLLGLSGIVAAMVGAAAALGLMLHHAASRLINLPDPKLEPIHGNAQWSTLEEALKHGLTRDIAAGIWAGWFETWRASRAKWWHWWQSWARELIPLAYDGENSVLHIGIAGSGKYGASVGPYAVTNQRENIIALDMKGEAFHKSAGWRRAQGFTIVVLNAYGVTIDGVALPESASINPLGELEIDAPGVETRLKTLAHVLCPVVDGDKNKHFSQAAQAFILAFLGLALELLGSKANLPLVAQWLHQDAAALNRHFAAMRHSRFAFVQDIGNEYWQDPDDKPNPHTNAMRDVLSTARGEIAWLSIGANRRAPENSSEIAKLFGYGATGELFSFAQLKTGRYTVYIILQPQSAAAFQKLNKLLIVSAMNTLNKPPFSPCTFVLDEMANALPPESGKDILDLMNTGRYVGLRLSMYLQNWGQAVGMFGPNAMQTLRAGAGLLTFYGANDPATCEAIRREIGKRTVWQQSSSPRQFFEGVGAEAADLLTDQEIRAMLDDGRQITFTKGNGFPVLLYRRPFYFEVPDLKARAEMKP